MWSVFLCLGLPLWAQESGAVHVTVNAAEGRQIIQGFGLNFPAPYFRDEQKPMFDMAIDDLGGVAGLWQFVPRYRSARVASLKWPRRRGSRIKV